MARSDILAEAAGITAGSWYAAPASHVGYELIAAGISSLLVAATVYRSTMANLSVGRDWDSSGERRHGAASGDFATLTGVRGETAHGTNAHQDG
jgi:hypothetical protein